MDNLKIKTPIFSQKEKMFFLIFLVVIAATILKFVYVFVYTDYISYMESDRNGPWTRALEYFNGYINANQWLVYPPLFHIILAKIFKISTYFGFFDYNLQIIISLNIILSSVSVVYLYLLSYNYSKNYIVAFCTATLYAFTFHIFYFNAFVFSENFALPLVIIATYYLFLDKKIYLIISGILLAIATGIRPEYGILCLPFVLFALFSNPESIRGNLKKEFLKKGIMNAFLFLIGFAGIIFLIISENNRISGGHLKGLSNSTGVEYYISFLKPYAVISNSDSFAYSIYPPNTIQYPENGTLNTTVPIYKQLYFIKLANEYIREHPQILLTKLFDLRDLYFGNLMPNYGIALNSSIGLGIDKLLLPPFRLIFLLLTLVVIFSIFTNPFYRVCWKKYLVLVSVIFLSVLMCYFLGGSHRYVLTFIFALYIIGIEIIYEVIVYFNKLNKKLIVFTLFIFGFFLVNAGVLQLNKWTMKEKIQATLIQDIQKGNVHTQDITEGDTTKFNIDIINFPFEQEFTHKTLGNMGHKEYFLVDFSGSFETLCGRIFHFSFYSNESFELYIDSILIVEHIQPYRLMESEADCNLSEGMHTFRILYYHGGSNSGIRAVYYPLNVNEDRKYYIGEDSEYIRFNTLGTKGKALKK